MVWYVYKSRDGRVYLVYEALTPSLMTGDYLLFDTAEDCLAWCDAEGIKVDGYLR